MIREQITRIGAYGVITEGNQILLCRLSSQIVGREGWWTLPGGGIDFGEHPEAGMIREVKEETGLDAFSLGLLGVDSIQRENEEHEFHALRIIYNAEVSEGELIHETEGTTDMCAWHNLKDLEHLMLVDLVSAALKLRGEAHA